MASNTENLNLLMKNPSTDGADTFNIQTMLNENWQKIDNNAGTVAQTLANILKPTTPPIIGLPPSTTPDGMFQALGNTGELHVWRKMVVTGTAKVELEPAVSGYIVSNNGSNYNQTIKYSSAIDEKGNLSGTITTLTVAYNTSNSDLFVLKGKYFEAGTTEISSNLKSPGGVWYIPNDASIQYITGQPSTTGYPYYYTHVATKMQKVVYVPAGTTTTYPVSTNPNAYQEGSDAKEAGYTLGDVVSGSFMLEGSYNSSHPTRYNIADTPTVSDDGSLSIPETQQFAGYGSYNNGTALQNGIKGKFIQFYLDPNYPGYGQSSFRDSGVVFIPENVVCTNYNSASGVYIDRYQPVTGYAAIPAGTTIEYLGRLGDKARVQVVSYVGTGTHGEGNPQSISVDFKIKAILLFGYFDDVYGFYHTFNNSSSAVYIVTSVLKTSYTPNMGLSWNDKSKTYGKISADGKTFTWYTTERYADLNSVGEKYFFLVIG